MSQRFALIVDADDTLWENNIYFIYFERAFQKFCDFLNHSSLTPFQVREVLNEIELVNAKIHGYGSRNFGRNLQEAYRHLTEREIREEMISST
jgi:putative hydrolase of the HAD superfamily